MTILPNTYSNMLSGNYNFPTMTMKMAFTPNYANNPSYISDITGIVSTSDPISSLGITIDTGPFSSSASTSLTASDCYFSSVPAYTNSYTYFYIYNDTGNPSTSPILFSTTSYNLNLYGEMFYKFTNNKLFYISDYYYNTRYIFRKTRKKMLEGSLGNFNNLNLRVAFLKNSYVLGTTDVYNFEFYSTVSPYAASTGRVINPYIEGGSYKTPSVVVSDTLTSGTINSIVVYHDTGNPATSPLICYYSAVSPITIDTKYPSFGFYQNTIFSL